MLNIKSELAPKGINFNVTDFIISGKYCTIFTIISYPKYVPIGYLSDLSNIAGVKVVAKHIPIEFSTMSKMINKEIADLKMRYQNENDRTIQERIRQDYESLEQFVQMLAATQSRIFDFQLHVMIMGDSKEDLENKKMNVRSFLDAMGMQGIPLMFEQEKVLKSILPIFPEMCISLGRNAKISPILIPVYNPSNIPAFLLSICCKIAFIIFLYSSSVYVFLSLPINSCFLYFIFLFGYVNCGIILLLVNTTV